MDRRQLVTGIAATAALTAAGPLARPARAQTPEKLVALGHKVHQQIIMGERGGEAKNLAEPWLKDKGVKSIEWVTYGLDGIHDKLFREASLPRSTVDVGFLLNSYASPRITELLEPLEEWQQKAPVEEMADFFPNMVKTLTVKGRLYGIPMRATTTFLHYNRAVFEERGVAGPPKTIEEFADIARKCTFTRPSGEKVYGFSVQGTKAEIFYPLLDLSRAWDGDYLTADYRVVLNEPPVVKALTLLRDLVKDGVMPPNITTHSNTDEVRFVQSGRSAMTVHGSNYHATFNDPKNSKVAGQFAYALLPASREMAGKLEFAPTKTEFWSFVIPRTAPAKALSWDFIRTLSSKRSIVQMALNGNSPTRASAYADAQIKAKIPYAELEQKVLRVSRVPWPAFDQVSRAIDILGEEVHRALLGMKTPKQALDDAAKAITPLVPKA